MSNPYLSTNEAKIISLFCTDAIAKGMTVSLHDSCEWALKRSTDVQEILKEAAACGEDTFRFRDAEGKVVGSVYCIYGNGNDGLDCITDHTESTAMDELLYRAWDFVKQVEEKQYN